ncbi:hypothetical protein AB0K09_30805, partial [Streptomyces sp. NPDC049577]
MGTVSAIPENLLAYSDACTHGAEQLRTWVRTVLQPALRAYEKGGGLCSALDGQVTRQLTAAQSTDRDVRTVGRAFQETQHGVVTVRNSTMPVRASEQAVNAAFDLLRAQDAHRAQMDAGAALA